MRRLPRGCVIDNQVGGTTYRIRTFLGEGGFGAAYVAFRPDETAKSTVSRLPEDHQRSRCLARGGVLRRAAEGTAEML